MFARTTKLSIVALVAILGTSAVLLTGASSSQAGPPAAPGDVNGDGGTNIGDAVYLLNFLFSSGPAPVACAGGTSLTPEQEAILDKLSLVMLPDGTGGSVETLRVSGVNLQVVNGTGDTQTTNGTGNLIVGYNELGINPNGDDRTGSHNIVGGIASSYTAFGGTVVGLRNTITSNYNFAAGTNNICSNISSCTIGGFGNTASLNGSVCVAGSFSEAAGLDSAIIAGQSHFVDGQSAAILGGAGVSLTTSFGCSACP